MTVITPSGQPTPKQPSDYTPAGQSLVVSWQLKRLPPPSALYVTADDVLLASAASNQASESVTINIRRLDANDARPHLEQFVLQPGSNRAVVTKSKPLAEGFILSISCQAAVATTRGQTFLRLGMGNAALGPNQPAQQLMADYVTTAMAPGHPNGRVLAPTEGPGWVRAIGSSATAHGVEASFTVPTNAVLSIRSIFTTLSTSAIAGTRSPTLVITDPNIGGSTAFKSGTLAGTGPSLAADYNFGAAEQPATLASGNLNQASLPAVLKVRAGDVIKTSTFGFDPTGGTGDLWATLNIFVEEWLDNV
jgi:hypothetical protein